jgi:FkbM family methyltransferase
MEALSPLYITSAEQRVVLPGGAQMLVDLNEHVQRWIYFFGVYEEQTVRWFRNTISPGMTVLDVGAHVGQYALLAAAATGPSGQVHAFEPNPAAFLRLIANLKLNNYENLHAHQVALSDASGDADLYLPSNNNLGEASLLKFSKGLDTRTVQCVTLDEWAEAVSLERLDLIKLDVQGLEPKVITGAKRVLERFRPTLVCEFEERWLRGVGSSTPEFKRQLANLDYEPFRITGDGLKPVAEGVVHSFENLVLVPAEKRPRLA